MKIVFSEASEMCCHVILVYVVHNSDMRDSHEYIQKQVWVEWGVTRQSRLLEVRFGRTHVDGSLYSMSTMI